MYKIDNASFRDPKGYVVHHNNNVFRVINNSYKEEYEHCTKSGLFKKLIDEGLLLLFEEIPAVYIFGWDNNHIKSIFFLLIISSTLFSMNLVAFK